MDRRPRQMNKSKLIHSSHFFLLLILCISTSGRAWSQDPSFQTGHELEAARTASEITLVGQQLWFVPIPKKIMRFGFARSTRHADVVLSERLYPTTPVKLSVVEKIARSSETRFQEFYRVKFEDGSDAFIEAVHIDASLFKYTSTNINEKNLHLARLYLEFIKEYFFKEDPTIIQRKMSTLDTAIADRQKQAVAIAHKKAAKAHNVRQALSGVLVGMSKKQVLASSWGKPREVNSTILKGAVTEQWVYPEHNYLYFDNDHLTAIQTSQ